MARATATLCCSPPESSWGMESRLWLSPSSPRREKTLFLTARGPAPATCRGSATLSKTVLSGRSLKSWKTTPIFRRSSWKSEGFILSEAKPATSTRPLEGRSPIQISRSIVVFPAPLGPVSTTNSPGSTLKETSSRAGHSE